MTATAAVVKAGVVAVLRAADCRHFPAIVDVLVSAGITAVEITLTCDGALDCLSALAGQYAGSEILIGAGSVMEPADAQRCLAAGARFLMSPVLALDALRVASAAGVPMYPGALTPSEMHAAVAAGAEAVKLFPAAAVSPRYIAEIRAPLPAALVIPTGGIAVSEVSRWLGAGAAAVGLGGSLIGDAASGGPDAALAGRARLAVGLARRARAGQRGSGAP